MQKVRSNFLNFKKLLQIIKLHYILGSFHTKEVLFHHSLTVLIHYRLLKNIRLESRSPKNLANLT